MNRSSGQRGTTTELESLYKVLSSIHSEETSASIVLIGKENASQRTVSATARIDRGRSIEIRFPNKTSTEALAYFLDLELTNIIVTKKPEDNLGQVLENALDMTDAMHRIAGRLSQQTQAAPNAGENLYEDVRRLLIDLYGDSVAGRIGRIAEKHPPKDSPRDFLDKCRGLVDVNYGKKLGQELFAKFYNELN